MKTILVVSDNVNVFSVNSVCKELEKHNLRVLKSSFDEDGIQRNIDESHVIFVLLSDEADVKRSLFMQGFKKRIVDCNRKIVIYGSREKVNDMRTIFSDDMIAEEFIRPIDNEQMMGRLLYVVEGGDRKDKLKHVLVVDDSGPMLRTIMGWLERKYKVSLANSAANARGVIDRDMPDLILLDYEMPICSGPQFLKRLREDEKTKDIPVIFLTGQSDSDSVRAVLELKPQGYILKSLSGTKVVEKIDEFFGK